MKLPAVAVSVSVFGFLLSLRPTTPFSLSTTTRSSSLKTTTSLFSTSPKRQQQEGTEAERLLAKAAALRAEAAKAEHQVHSHEVEKRKQYAEEMDRRIDQYFFSSPNTSLVDKLQTKRPCIDTLKGIVERLYQRQLEASGKEHVVVAAAAAAASNSGNDSNDDHVDFQRVQHSVDEIEMARLDGLIEKLINAVGTLDTQLKANKEATGKVHVNHIEEEHFGGLDSAKKLEQYYHELRREQEEHYQKRQKSIIDAQTIKKEKDGKRKNPPPPKQKDHMMHP